MSPCSRICAVELKEDDDRNINKNDFGADRDHAHPHVHLVRVGKTNHSRRWGDTCALLQVNPLPQFPSRLFSFSCVDFHQLFQWLQRYLGMAAGENNASSAWFDLLHLREKSRRNNENEVYSEPVFMWMMSYLYRCILFHLCSLQKCLS